MHSFPLLTAMLVLLPGTFLHAQIIPFNSEQWEISAKGYVIDAYAGKANTLFLQNGAAILPDADFENGIIEFDIFLENRRGFPGVLFRRVNELNYEEFYVRPHLSGMPDAMQYSPVCDGNSAWQLYHDQAALVNNGYISFDMTGHEGFNTAYTFPFDRWLHIKMVVSGTRADVYFDHEDSPTLQVRDLRRGVTKGGIGIKAAVSPFYFADFSFTKMDKAPITTLDVRVVEEPNRIRTWQVSSALTESTFDNLLTLNGIIQDTLSWTNATSEPGGILNISAQCVRPDRDHNTALVKTTLRVNGAQLRELELGYSDRVKVYCNGQIIYGGNNSYLTRDYRFLGTIGYFDSVFLPLHDGANEIVFAVSETFGGWGLQARLKDLSGVTFE